MKEYKLVHLGKGFNLLREKGLEQSQMIINEHVMKGWELQQIVSADDSFRALIGVFYRES